MTRSTTIVLVTALGLAAAGVANAGDVPACHQDKNLPLATKSFETAIADVATPVRKAYELFLTQHQPEIENRYSSVADAAGASQIPQRMDWYRKPVANHWVRVIPLGTSRGTEGTSKADAATTCDDEYLVLVAPPVETKWGGQHLLFEVRVVVKNGAKGPTTMLFPQSLIADVPDAAADTKH
jgi:hypothetical protein